MTEFNALFKFTGKEVKRFLRRTKISGRIHGLKFLVQVDADHDKIGSKTGRLLIITPRTCGKAVDRNKLRRRLKNIFYTNSLYSRPQISIIIASSGAMLLNFDQLRKFLTDQLSCSESIGN